MGGGEGVVVIYLPAGDLGAVQAPVVVARGACGDEVAATGRRLHRTKSHVVESFIGLPLH